MLTINKQDVFKTVVIIWFVATTGYVVFDLYTGYKIQGMQQAYQTGYTTAVDDLMKKSEESQCQPFEAQKDDKKIQLVNARCLQQSGSQPSQSSGSQTPSQSEKTVK
jgi:hypothetical protein